MIVCKRLKQLAELATGVHVQQSEQPVFGTDKLILQHDFLFILPRIKICENRMDEVALKVARIGEAVSIIRLRLRRVLQDGSSSLREINCGSLLLCCFTTPSTADLRRAEAQGRRFIVRVKVKVDHTRRQSQS
jgi:hypothetical protein